MSARSFLVLISTVAACLACGGLEVPVAVPIPAVSVGDSVEHQGTSAKLTALYGKLAEIEVDAKKRWVVGGELSPSVPASPLAATDTCTYAKDAAVEHLGKAAKVVEVYGSMARVEEGGETMWSRCADLKAPAAKPAPRNNGRAAAIQKCKSGCNKRCRGARNKSKCVGQCRRDCSK
jgi:hypothetical protein